MTQDLSRFKVVEHRAGGDRILYFSTVGDFATLHFRYACSQALDATQESDITDVSLWLEYWCEGRVPEGVAVFPKWHLVDDLKSARANAVREKFIVQSPGLGGIR